MLGLLSESLRDLGFPQQAVGSAGREPIMVCLERVGFMLLNLITLATSPFPFPRPL